MADTYYVDFTTGDDLDSGLTEALAWKTIGKVNGSTFNAGDSILFKRGETWTESNYLGIDFDGSEGSYISIGNYGSGALPVFNQLNTLGFYCPSQLSHSYIIIDGIDCNVNNGNYGMQLWLQHSIIRNCVARNAIGVGIVIRNASDVLVENCTAYENAGNGGIIFSCSETEVITGVIIQNNICHDNGTSPTADHGIYVGGYAGGGATNIIIQGNTCYNNSASGIKYNTVSNSIIRYNKCYGNSSGIFLGAELGKTLTGIEVYYNLCYNNTPGSGITLVGDGCDNNEIYNNTLYLNYNVDGGSAGIYFASDGSSGNVVKNNIIYQDNDVASTCGVMRFNGINVRNNTTTDYNRFYWKNRVPANGIIYVDGVGYYTLAAWQAIGKDLNSTEGDPLMVDPGNGDFMLQPTSPCINAGANVGLTQDYAGKKVPQ